MGTGSEGEDMRISDGCKPITVQIGEKLRARAEKVRARNCTQAELIRRALAAYVEMREKAGETEPYTYEVRGFDGDGHSRPGSKYR
jgi:hypothetical protein